ncbi:hypothetical protein B0T26DRAFT_675241 [Lasiosphaeria miniovina]|uniref:Uncharacterized protein n=1 Tax=Lasiosphaeria miniovina TaxID=1954250 RepID=A0AA40AJ45_9PEZI|nr:uncharacterized protein B0T26DRAFT_675241 [Lasiosphaeria miniovina]KAK0716821.1 hypothetical protein B0T26DRAFT_675241 [Lasiosphaeria miniovina]
MLAAAKALAAAANGAGRLRGVIAGAEGRGAGQLAARGVARALEERLVMVANVCKVVNLAGLEQQVHRETLHERVPKLFALTCQQTTSRTSLTAQGGPRLLSWCSRRSQPWIRLMGQGHKDVSNMAFHMAVAGRFLHTRKSSTVRNRFDHVLGSSCSS